MFFHLSIANILCELVSVQIAYFLNATYLSINDHTFCRGLLHTLRNGVLSAKSFYNVVCKLQIYIYISDTYIYIYQIYVSFNIYREHIDLSNPSNFTMAGQHPSAQPLRCFQLSPGEFLDGTPVQPQFLGGIKLDFVPQIPCEIHLLDPNSPVYRFLPDIFNIFHQLPWQLS